MASQISEERMEEIRGYLGTFRDDPMAVRLARTGLELLSEIDRLRLREEALIHSYEAKVDDFAAETLRVDKLLAATKYDGGRYMVGEAGLGWNEAMKYVRASLNVTKGELVP